MLKRVRYIWIQNWNYCHKLVERNESDEDPFRKSALWMNLMCLLKQTMPPFLTKFCHVLIYIFVLFSHVHLCCMDYSFCRRDPSLLNVSLYFCCDLDICWKLFMTVNTWLAQSCLNHEFCVALSLLGIMASTSCSLLHGFQNLVIPFFYVELLQLLEIKKEI